MPLTTSDPSNSQQGSQFTPAPWSLDLRSWHLTWSDEVRVIHDVPATFFPSLWEALGFIDAEDLPELLERAASSIRTGVPLDSELCVVAASGVRKQVRLAARSLLDADGRPRMLEGTLAVIGMAPQKHVNNAAEARIALLESALRDWETFARAIPHELKSPMIIIGGLATVLHKREKDALTERGRHYLDSIRRAAEHAKSLSEALLVLAPMSMQSMRHEDVDLSSIAHKVVDLLRVADDKRNVEVAIEPGMCTTGDPDLIRALLANLLGNAWKFTSQQPTARITFRLVATGANQTFCVSDNGVGFDSKRASEIFMPLVRLHDPAEFGGSGIGLVIARRVVERHTGRIWADARAGEGAKFFFSLG